MAGKILVKGSGSTPTNGIGDRASGIGHFVGAPYYNVISLRLGITDVPPKKQMPDARSPIPSVIVGVGIYGIVPAANFIAFIGDSLFDDLFTMKVLLTVRRALS